MVKSAKAEAHFLQSRRVEELALPEPEFEVLREELRRDTFLGERELRERAVRS